MTGKKPLKMKYLVMGNLIIDIVAIWYFVYIYFFSEAYVMEGGQRLTNYEFWGVSNPAIILHFAAPSLIIIGYMLIFTVIMAKFCKWRKIKD